MKSASASNSRYVSPFEDKGKDNALIDGGQEQDRTLVPTLNFQPRKERGILDRLGVGGKRDGCVMEIGRLVDDGLSERRTYNLSTKDTHGFVMSASKIGFHGL
jgi:hypothetical protein